MFKFKDFLSEHIVKLASGKYRLLSHKGKNLGTFDSHGAAAKHEGEVEYFKAHEEAGDPRISSASDEPITAQDSFSGQVSEAVTPGAQLFHKDIGIPPMLRGPLPGMRLKFGPHAQRELSADGLTSAPTAIPPHYTLIEVETIRGITTKWVIRFPCQNVAGYDLVLVVQTDGFVRTAWLNKNDDGHRTLDRRMYTPPTQFRGPALTH